MSAAWCSACAASGASDADALAAVLSMVQLRMMTGSENPVELLTEDDRT